jgi:hypothetical protein
MLQETIKSRDFAEKVARRAGIPDLVFLLPSVTYGGQQKLTLRNLGGTPPSAIELRLSMPTAELARTAMNAVGDEIAQLQSTETGARFSAPSQSRCPSSNTPQESLELQSVTSKPH